MTGISLSNVNTLANSTLSATTTLSNLAYSVSNVAYPASSTATAASNIAVAASNVAYPASSTATAASNIAVAASNLAYADSNILRATSNIAYPASSAATAASNIAVAASNVSYATSNVSYATSNVAYATSNVAYSAAATAAAASNQAFTPGAASGAAAGMLSTDSNNAGVLSVTSAWSLVAPRAAYVPTLTSAMTTPGGTDAAQGLALDASSNCYVSGVYGPGTATLFNSNVAASALALPTTTGTAAYVAKYTSAGTATWAVAVDGLQGGSTAPMAIDAASNVYIAGTYTSARVPTVYNTGASSNSGTATLPGTSGTAAVLVKYSSNAQASWAACVTNAMASTVNTDSASNIILAGASAASATPIIYDASMVNVNNTNGVFLAGSGTATFAEGTGTAASFSSPQSVVYDSTRAAFYVSDMGNHRIRKVTPAGVVTTLAGTGTAGSTNGSLTAAQFNFPEGIALDSTNANLYVADTGNHCIRRVDLVNGTVSTWAGSPGLLGGVNATGTNARFSSPADVCCDSSYIYVADRGNNVIRSISTSTQVVSLLVGNSNASGSADGVGTNARFSQPNGIAIDITGMIYVADTNNHTIRQVNTGNSTVTTVAGAAGFAGSNDGTGTAAQFSFPRGLQVRGNTGNGDIYIATNSGVRKTTTAGVVTTVVGSGTITSIYYPKDVAFDSTTGSNLFVVDGNQRMHKITLDASVPTPVLTVSSNVTLPTPASTSAIAVKYGPTGLSQWSLAVDGASADEGCSAICDNSNNVFLVGRYGPGAATVYQGSNAVSGLSNLLAASSGTAVFGIKGSSNGVPQWSVRMDGTGTDRGIAAVSDAAGSLYVTGSYQSSNAVIYSANGSTFATLPNPANTSTFLAKFSAAGAAQWVSTIRQTDSTGSNAGLALSVDASSNVYIAGTYSGQPVITDSSNVASAALVLPVAPGGATSGYVVKYSSTGTPLAAMGLLGAGASSNASALAIAVDAAGSNVFAAGAYTAQVTLCDGNGLPLNTLPVAGSNTGSQTAVVARYTLSNSPFYVPSSLSSSSNGQQKYVTNVGAAGVTMNVMSSNQSAVLSSTTLGAGATALYSWFNGQWYKF